MPPAFLKKNAMGIVIALAALLFVALPVQQARADSIYPGTHTQGLLHGSNALQSGFLLSDQKDGRNHGEYWAHDGDRDDRGWNKETGAAKVAEPGTLALLVCGLLGLFLVAGARRKGKMQA